MRRRVAALALAGGLLSCQDYRFNPVGRCTIQPGQVRVPLTDVTVADVLFVVDDSFSMDPIQANLANNFGAFIGELANAQNRRVAQGKAPFDFYIAITSSSVLVNELRQDRCGATTPGQCKIADVNATFPPVTPYACSPAGSECAEPITKFYDAGGCTTGLSTYHGPYFAGSFVGAAGNPKVLAFTKSLNWAAYPGDAAINTLITQFGQNVQVGSCGANQEMHLEASRLAVQKAIAGTAPNTGWLHPGAKLVVVWVGNEDDCSTPPVSSGGLIWSFADTPGNDRCVTDANHQLRPVSEYASFFGALGRPFGAAFIRPGIAFGACACTNGAACGVGYGTGARFEALANAFRAQGASVVEGSVCDTNFGTSTLAQIANLVKPPDALKLPTRPAAGVVTQLRVLDGAGKTVHACVGPNAAQEWWFAYCDSDPTAVPPIVAGTPTRNAGGTADGTATSQCVQVRQGGACEVAPGQTLFAQYLGLVPAGGCSAAADCARDLGGVAGDWTCDGASGAVKGTCLCKPGP